MWCLPPSKLGAQKARGDDSCFANRHPSRGLALDGRSPQTEQPTPIVRAATAAGRCSIIRSNIHARCTYLRNCGVFFRIRVRASVCTWHLGREEYGSQKPLHPNNERPVYGDPFPFIQYLGLIAAVHNVVLNDNQFLPDHYKQPSGRSGSPPRERR